MNLVRTRLSRPTAAAAVLAALLVSGAATAAHAQVLQQVPSDALVVIKVNNLKAVSDKVAKFAEALGLSAVQPEFADPLASLQENMQIKEGVDTAGELAIVLTKMSEGDDDPEKSLMVIVPVSDYKAFLGNFPNAKTEGEVTDIENGERGFVTSRGKYAVLVQNKELLGPKPAGLKLSGLAAKEAKEKDAFIFANIPALSALALPELAKARTEGTQEIDKELGSDDDAKQFAGVAKAGFNQLINVAEGYMRDATAASLSLHLNDEGLQSTLVSEFKPDSYAGKLAAQFKNSNQPLMAGLPEGRKYFAAGGMINAPEVTSKIVGDLLDPIAKELATTQNAKSFASAIDSLKKAAGATKSFSFGYPVPTGEVGQDSLVQSVSVIRGDSKTIAETQKTMLSAVGDLMKLMPQQGGAEMKFEITPAAKTVGDVKLDAYKMDMKLDENNPQVAQAQQFMSVIYGQNGQSGVFGAVGKDAFVVVQGGNDELIEQAVNSAKNPKDPLTATAHVKSISGHLPSQRILTEYIFLDNIVTTGVRYAQHFNVPVNMKLEENLPPIGVTAATEGSAVRIDGFVPTKLVQALVASGMEAFMQMQGGGGGKAGDGL